MERPPKWWSAMNWLLKDCEPWTYYRRRIYRRYSTFIDAALRVDEHAARTVLRRLGLLGFATREVNRGGFAPTTVKDWVRQNVDLVERHLLWMHKNRVRWEVRA